MLIKPRSSWGSTFSLSSLKPEIVGVHKYYHVFGIDVAYVEAKVLQSVYGYTLKSSNGTRGRKFRVLLYYSSRSKGLLFRSPYLPLNQIEIDHSTHVALIHALVHVILHAGLPFIGG
ncbi:MAG: hypothetical protein ACFE9L_01610 [Candidatus Hodarchaeota archaeon]